MKGKKCFCCKKLKFIGDFSIRSKKTNKLKSYCKICESIKAKNRRSNKLKVFEDISKWIKDNVLGLFDISKCCIRCGELQPLINYALRSDTVKFRNWCIDCDKLAVKLHMKTHQYSYTKFLYIENNVDAIRAYKNHWTKEKCKNDINYKISKSLRSRLRSAIKHNKKIGSAVRDLGCSVDYLINNHFSSLFYPHTITGELMTLDNYGKWHIDHIIPLSSFDLTNPEQFKKACHYTNLQPLWAEDNLRKGAKII